MKNKLQKASKRAEETDEERKVRLEKDRERKREKVRAIKQDQKSTRMRSGDAG